MGLWDVIDQLRGGSPARRERRPREVHVDRPARRAVSPYEQTRVLSERPALQGPPPPPVESMYAFEEPRAAHESATSPLRAAAASSPPAAAPGPALVVAPPVSSVRSRLAPAAGVRSSYDGVAQTQYLAAPAAPEPVVGVLVGIAGDLEGELHALREGRNALGRDPRCQVQFSEVDKRISRSHAEILCQEGHYAIRPLSESNSTRVDGERIDEQIELRDGALISIGSSDFRFRSVAG